MRQLFKIMLLAAICLGSISVETYGMNDNNFVMIPIDRDDLTMECVVDNEVLNKATPEEIREWRAPIKI